MLIVSWLVPKHNIPFTNLEVKTQLSSKSKAKKPYLYPTKNLYVINISTGNKVSITLTIKSTKQNYCHQDGIFYINGNQSYSVIFCWLSKAYG